MKTTNDHQLDHNVGNIEHDDADLAHIIKDLHISTLNDEKIDEAPLPQENIITLGDPERNYSNIHKILLVGEGDFSFSSVLASAFHYAPNIIATSLDSRATVIENYLYGDQNLSNLELRGSEVVHEVDVHKMCQHPKLIQHKPFDRIVFNFPHAGGSYRPKSVSECDAWYIKCHQRVVSGFFEAAREMVGEKGEIHVTHKTNPPYDGWNIVELAEKVGLVLKRKAKFVTCRCLGDYPGYINRKGYGKKWDKSFPSGSALTFVFCTS